MRKEAVSPDVGPETKGPYSPAIVHGGLVFVSGQGPVDPETGQVLRGDKIFICRQTLLYNRIE